MLHRCSPLPPSQSQSHGLGVHPACQATWSQHWFPVTLATTIGKGGYRRKRTDRDGRGDSATRAPSLSSVSCLFGWLLSEPLLDAACREAARSEPAPWLYLREICYSMCNHTCRTVPFLSCKPHLPKVFADLTAPEAARQLLSNARQAPPCALVLVEELLQLGFLHRHAASALSTCRVSMVFQGAVEGWGAPGSLSAAPSSSPEL